MIQQYLGIKANYPDMLVLYRMGDFYELFFDDAINASKLLGISLTTRGASGGNPIKMAGVPFHSLDQYLTKLVKLDQSVVLVDQVGEVTGKALVERKVTRIITPGTLTESSLLDDKHENLIACIYKNKDQYGVATMSISAGTFVVNQIATKELLNLLTRNSPSELVVPESLRSEIQQLKLSCVIKTMPDWHFEYHACYKKLLAHFKVNDLQCFGIDNTQKLIIQAANVLLDYAKQTQCNELPHIHNIHHETETTTLKLDAISRTNLEINYTIKGERSPTLLSLFDNCATSMGSRKLKYWLNNPLTEHKEINARLHAVSTLQTCYEKLQPLLASIYDIERITTRIALRSAGPRDLASLRESLAILPELYFLADFTQDNLITTLSSVIVNFSKEKSSGNVTTKLQQALASSPNNMIRDGNVINDRYSAELDHLRDIQQNANKYLLELESSERNRTQIQNLKIEFNKVHGFYIEVSNSHILKVPPEYRRTQTLKNAERYTTPELKTFETEVLNAQDKALNLEKTLYEELLTYLNGYIKELQCLAHAIASIDVLNNFALIANKNNYVKPLFVENNTIEIKNGRHPVVEKQIEQFIANDINLNEATKFILITGPNMGGKSTYMRQTAIIVLLAYCGSFVPADSATLGPIDRIFTRIGASDDLSSGKSTFMVEMSETANILNNATNKSLVLLDEIGRGTSTLDGLSLAHAVARHLIEKIGCYSLFATHYFELTTLANQYNLAKNFHLSAVEHNDEIVFLHHVYEGSAEKSYGIQVASLAGIPKNVVTVAKRYLQQLESKQNNNQLDLFGEAYIDKPYIEIEHTPTAQISANEKELLEILKQIHPDNLSAREALELLYKLHRLINSNEV
jgi:DNA mismatch repair protein MutS